MDGRCKCVCVGRKLQCRHLSVFASVAELCAGKPGRRRNDFSYLSNYPSYDAETGSVEVGGMSFGITWNSAIVFIPYYLYQQYGDTTIIDENIDAIYKYMENLEKNPLTYGGPEDAQITETALTSQTGFLCDHLSVVTTDGSMLGNAMYTYCLDVVSQMAEAIGQTEKSRKISGHV